jgi:MFS family permease
MAAIPLSGVIGSPLAGWIMHAFGGLYGLRGWQWLFILEGIPAILLGIVAYLYLDDGPAASNWLSEDEKSLLLGELESDRRTRTSRSDATLGQIVRTPQFYRVAAMGSAIMISTSGAFLWLPTIIHNSGINNIVYVGLLSSVPFALGVAAQFIVAWSSDRTLERRWHVAVPALIAAAGWGSLPFVATNPTTSLILETVAISGTFGAMGPFWTLPSVLLPGSAAAVGIALVTTIAGFGNFISPILVGEMTAISGSLAAGQLYFAALLTIGVALLLMGRNEPRLIQANENVM